MSTVVIELVYFAAEASVFQRSNTGDVNTNGGSLQRKHVIDRGIRTARILDTGARDLLNGSTSSIGEMIRSSCN